MTKPIDYKAIDYKAAAYEVRVTKTLSEMLSISYSDAVGIVDTQPALLARLHAEEAGLIDAARAINEASVGFGASA